MADNTIIKVDDIYKNFLIGKRHTEVLRGITVEFSKGEMIIIFGPSGCGKSTLLHTLTGLEKPDSGAIYFQGINMSDLEPDDIASLRKHEIGVMYQQQNWIKALNVIENVAFSAQLIGLNKEEALVKAGESLQSVGMEHRAEYIPTELSAGEQQKASMARALVTNPKVLIADEPTGNLDVKSGIDVVERLQKLRDEGITVVMVTHNPEYLGYADRVLFMFDGKVYKEVRTKGEDMAQVEKKVRDEIKKFVEKGVRLESNGKDIVPGNRDEVTKKRNIFQYIMYVFFLNIRFLFQAISYLFYSFLGMLSKKFNKQLAIKEKFRNNIDNISRLVEGNTSGKITPSIGSLDLIEISFKNLLVKKSRTFITIFGISLGIGFIVFLLSIGYGLEKLLIAEMTKVESLNQVDVLPVPGSGVVIDSEKVKIFEDIQGVESVYPLSNSATRVSFNSANTDVVAYGITKGYLEASSSDISTGRGIDFKDDSKQAVVNREYVNILNISPSDIVGKEITISLMSNSVEETKDVESLFTVTGVIEDSNPPILYMKMSDLLSGEIEEYSEVRVILEDSASAKDVRKKIEVLGFQTISISDTIEQVESIFDYVRLGLLLIGVIAFIVAILGMVNTLTISLLERTREVGLMKTIGMRSEEIANIFINESMLMGFCGGMSGVVVGLFVGFLISSILSIISVSRGGEIMMFTFLPFWTGMLIVIISTLVGFLTGLYPSNRAVKMNPLDALRYE